MYRRARMTGIALLFCTGCWGVPRAPKESPQAWRSAQSSPVEALPRLPLVPVVPELTQRAPSPFVPFVTEAALPNAGSVLLATTNNSLDARMDPQARGFALCLRSDAVHYHVEWLVESGELYTTAEVALAGNLGNCSQMTGPVNYLVLEGAPSSRSDVNYRVVSSNGFSPPVSCNHPGMCPPLHVSLSEVEQALGGLTLGALRLPVPAPRVEVPTDIVATPGRRSSR